MKPSFRLVVAQIWGYDFQWYIENKYTTLSLFVAILKNNVTQYDVTLIYTGFAEWGKIQIYLLYS